MQGTIWNMGPAKTKHVRVGGRSLRKACCAVGNVRREGLPCRKEVAALTVTIWSETARSQTWRASELKMEVGEASPPPPPVELMKHTGSHTRLLLLWSTRVPSKKEHTHEKRVE